MCVCVSVSECVVRELSAEAVGQARSVVGFRHSCFGL